MAVYSTGPIQRVHVHFETGLSLIEEWTKYIPIAEYYILKIKREEFIHYVLWLSTCKQLGRFLTVHAFPNALGHGNSNIPIIPVVLYPKIHKYDTSQL